MPILSEAQTRKQLINDALRAAGWSPITRPHAPAPAGPVTIKEYPTASGPVDYALFHHGEPLALVEAKKLAVGPQNVLQQAQR